MSWIDQRPDDAMDGAFTAVGPDPGRTGAAGGDRFASGDWLTLSTGSPVLASAVIAFDCRIVEVRSVGSHNVFFGAVETVRLGPGGPALVYHDRAYKRV